MTATEIRKGMVLDMEGGLFVVMDCYHVKLAKGGAAVQCKLRDLKRGSQSPKRFRSSDRVETAFLETKTMEYLYPDGDMYCFMDTETYDQIMLSQEFAGEAMQYVVSNSQARIVFHEGKPISVELPSAVVLEVTETEPGQKGNTVTNVTKAATLETGLQIKVPLHVDKGDRVKVDTRTGEFLARA